MREVWKHDQFPVIEIGIIELNKNPIDYFTEVEQIAFSPARVVPGIGYSPDRLLQGRLHWYDDTQFHRVGSNFKQLPINRPRNAPARNICNGGFMHIDIQDRFPTTGPIHQITMPRILFCLGTRAIPKPLQEFGQLYELMISCIPKCSNTLLPSMQIWQP
eukprot:TRINITY_DN4831_c0_g1_i1.p1 TRINITY_DN4831_c0_g1~~TRINITY_DN4831_c0_g1_i1.p1  ORF type:complete len:160 (+),score=31.27 TRINITY_DN4831_c0_g1_i1:488-967(+)